MIIDTASEGAKREGGLGLPSPAVIVAPLRIERATGEACPPKVAWR